MFIDFLRARAIYGGMLTRIASHPLSFLSTENQGRNPNTTSSCGRESLPLLTWQLHVLKRSSRENTSALSKEKKKKPKTEAAAEATLKPPRVKTFPRTGFRFLSSRFGSPNKCRKTETPRLSFSAPRFPCRRPTPARETYRKITSRRRPTTRSQTKEKKTKKKRKRYSKREIRGKSCFTCFI